MEEEAVVDSSRSSPAPFLRGVIGGALGAIAFLPIMIVLQPTLWATVVFNVWPGVNRITGEVAGWLIHVGVLALWGGLLGGFHRPRVAAETLVSAVGWAFIAGWFTMMAMTLILREAIPALGWILETVGHLAYGAVLGGTLWYFAHSASAAEDTA